MTRKNTKPLRFAAMPRVSTEKQEKQGESLRTQRKEIDEAVKALGGKIVGWYGGQEHATSGWERAERDRMLADAEKAHRPFDAIMVQHADRWSRDDTQSGADLDRLKASGVRFYVLTNEQDLYDPTVRLYLGISAVVGAYHARNQCKKSIENRIERARRGIPSAGRMPFGRTFDRETGQWGIDPAKKAQIEDIARRYLAGESMPKLSAEYGMNVNNLYDTLRYRCGTRWELEFRADDLGIHEAVTLTVPRLLDEKTIREIHKRLEANATYLHRPPVSLHDYLLRGRIFCSGCGYAMTGQAANPSGILYYRHRCRRLGSPNSHGPGSRPCPFDPQPWVPARAIERAVLTDLFNLFGNPAAIERAVKAAVPDCDKALKRQEHLKAELAKVERARGRVLDLIDKDALTDAQAEGKLRELKEREDTLQAQLDEVAATLADVPDAEEVKRWVHRIEDGCGPGIPDITVFDDNGEMYVGGNDVASWLSMNFDTPEDKKALIDAAFAAPLPGGKPAGVYITPAGGTRYGPKKFTYTIKGRLVQVKRGVVSSAGR
jgi:DNA invertase Pin-like site-specific DNA recombinase